MNRHLDLLFEILTRQGFMDVAMAIASTTPSAARRLSNVVPRKKYPKGLHRTTYQFGALDFIKKYGVINPTFGDFLRVEVGISGPEDRARLEEKYGRFMYLRSSVSADRLGLLINADLDSYDWKNVVHHAAEMGKHQILKYVHEKVCALARSKELLFGGVKSGSIDTVRYLLNRGCMPRDMHLRQALHMRDTKMAKLLIKRGCKVTRPLYLHMWTLHDPELSDALKKRLELMDGLLGRPALRELMQGSLESI